MARGATRSTREERARTAARSIAGFPASAQPVVERSAAGFTEGPDILRAVFARRRYLERRCRRAHIELYALGVVKSHARVTTTTAP
jgi:hypothetical protein